MKFDDQIELYKDIIDNELMNIYNDGPEIISKPIYHILRGGKRYRPILCLLTSLCFKGNENSATIVGTAIELLHNFSLIHDDIMDNDYLRHGYETIHSKWNKSIAILSGDADEQRKKILESLEVGSVHEGLIKNITDFGAFIDLGGIDGLLHITDITWGRINHPNEKLSIGDKIKVKIIDFDEKLFRISLGTKQLTDDPWKNASTNYEISSTVKGKVVNLMNYGMFVELQEGIEGLVHISEMSWTKHLKHPSDMFKMGDKIESKVLSINTDDKKISLGIKQLSENPWSKVDDLFNVGDIYVCKIKNIINNGTFLSLNDEIEGFLHNNDLCWTRKIQSINEIADTNSLEVKIIDISTKDKKISLSHKHLIANPWESIDDHVKINSEYSGKVIFKLEKNIVCLLENNFEGIIPLDNTNMKELNDININVLISVKIKDINLEKRKLIFEYSHKIENKSNDEKNIDNKTKSTSKSTSKGK